MRRVHLALTLALAVALGSVVIVSLRQQDRAEHQLETKKQENAALRKRAETAEASTRLVIERFGEAMKGLASEAGHFSGRDLAKHQKSFVQVYSFYRRRSKEMATAGTACYLGDGYFLTAKHVVVQEAEDGKPAPKTTKIALNIDGHMVSARTVDTGEAPAGEPVDVEDWAVLLAERAPENLVAVKPRAGYRFMFGERLVRYGNDSNRGIAVAAGYVAQVSDSGWISWLVDSLPGCSGGGVLNGKDELVGLNGGYLDGSTRLAVIIPVRAEMFRKLPKPLVQSLTEHADPAGGLH